VTTKRKAPTKKSVAIEVSIYPRETMFLRQSVGTAEYDGQKWEITP
jgi:hypothetical protein